MKLYQVRKGQFVYYNNELHRVYGVKPMYKQSVHIIRLRDLTQQLTKSASVEKVKPKELDSFIFNHKAYTLSRDRKAEVGDYVLIHNPMPDSLDTYSLNEIDLVETVDKQGVVTSNSHGIKHNEYLLMVPGRANGSTSIDYQNSEGVDAENLQDADSNDLHNQNNEHFPAIGDIYKNDEGYESMVVALKRGTVYLGGGLELSQEELRNSAKWEFLYNLLDK
ncbi:hypothetical protein QNH48_27445 [Neobacillus sp. YX16]|uniref:hypothetical protein n=1 Tax=Neobacillus sp. YX16 TaxID=3047874 RepID=UPI0024C3F6C7|nr:hypothetical protein [Neobacillus sp. YX16]WHZ02616.1 hypothetical protein QNH48_27445 [Neobacillus sp. YX16]